MKTCFQKPLTTNGGTFITKIILTFLLISLSFYTSAATYYVDANASSTGATGAKIHPFTTIQSAVNRCAPFDSIYVRNGVYRENVIIPPAKNNIILSAYMSEKPILKGSDIFTNWQPTGSYWQTSANIRPQQVFIDGDNPLQQIGYPNDDFKKNQSYPRYNHPVGVGLSDMQKGSFYWENGILYIWPSNGRNPNESKVEVSTRVRILTLSAKNVTVKGLSFRHSNINSFTEQGGAVQLGIGSVIQDCDVQWCDFAGIALASNAKVINCVTSHNGNVGIAAFKAFNFIVSGCKSNYNNYRNFHAQWNAGGFKAAGASWGIIEKSEFSYNIGAGIWFDYCFQQPNIRTDGIKPIVIQNNYVHHNSLTDNKNSALMLEMTENATVRNNRVAFNDYRGIYLSASWDCQVLNNQVYRNTGHYAIDLAGLPRTGESRAKLTNNIVQGNVISDNTASYDMEILENNSNNIKNNISNNNVFSNKKGAVKLRSGKVFTLLKDWSSSTGFDKNSKQSSN